VDGGHVSPTVLAGKVPEIPIEALDAAGKRAAIVTTRQPLKPESVLGHASLTELLVIATERLAKMFVRLALVVCGGQETLLRRR
jgi:hypothetical protein